MAVRSYDLKQVLCTFGGVRLQGFGEGDAISIAWEANIFDTMVGADGETTRSRTNNNNAKATVTLMQTSNAHFALIEQALRNSALTQLKLPFALIDPNTSERFISPEAYVEKLPDSPFGMAAGTREWTLYLPDCKISLAEILQL